jgi:hypothetical protein
VSAGQSENSRKPTNQLTTLHSKSDPSFHVDAFRVDLRRREQDLEVSEASLQHCAFFDRQNLASSSTKKEHIPEGKGKVGNGLKAKNRTTFIGVNIPKDKSDLADVITDDIMILKTVSGRKLVDSVIKECVGVLINFPDKYTALSFLTV